MMVRTVCLAGLLVAVGACGGGSDDAGSASTVAGAAEGDIVEVEPTDATPSTIATGDTVAEPVETTLPAVSEDPGVAEDLGLAPIELLTAADGGGPRPVLEWSPVDGAAQYHVVVLAPNGSTYWAWRTSDTSVPVGGLPQLSPDAAGPAVAPGMSWSVLATAEDRTAIALSGRRPIAP